MAISTIVLALTGGGESAPTPAPKPSDKSGLKERVIKHLQVESLTRSTPACVKHSDLSKTIAVYALEMSGLYLMASFG